MAGQQSPRMCSQCAEVEVDRPCGICQGCLARMCTEQRVAQGLPPKPTDASVLDEIARIVTPKRVA